VRRRGLLSTAAITAFLLSALPTAPASATFAGHNGRIAFTIHGRADIATMNPDGSGKQTLTSFIAGSSVEYPRYSPDGRKIVFDANDPTNHPTSSYDIYSMTSTGLHLKRLTSDTSNYDDWGASFSPNGRKIAFISDRGGSFDVWTMNADGTNPQQVTTTANAEYTSWSPDGHWILFDSDLSGTSEIYRVQPDGSHQKALTSLPFTGSNADWSPNGNLIAFSGSKTGGASNVWVMNADGTHRHQVTTGTSNDYNTVWSPDGNWIAFDRTPFGSKGVRLVMKVRADGTGLDPLTGTSSNNADPGWQPT
jgi:TolB protein